MKTKNSYPMITSSVVSLLIAAPFVAQSEEQTELGTITVTSSRIEERNLEVPASVQSKGAEDIQLDSPAYQKELFNSIAGVRVTQTGSTLGHMTAIRMPNSTSPYYLFLQDGIPVQSSGFFNHNGLAYTNFSSAGSAEVLKGAGTALYGSDAIAATINVRSAPIPDEPEIKTQLEAGPDGYFDVGASAAGAVAKGRAQISFGHTSSDGWREHTEHDRSEFNLRHELDLDDKNNLKTQFSLNTTEAEMAGSLIGLDELENNAESVGDVADAIASGQEVKRKFDFARLSTEWTHTGWDKGTLSAIAYLRGNRNRYTATWQKNLPENDSKENSLGLMFKADMTGENSTTMIGLDTELTDANREYTQLTDYVPTRFGSAVAAGTIYDYDVRYTALSPYARSEYMLTDTIILGGGLRYDYNKYDYTNNTDSGQYAESTYSRPDSSSDESFNHLSPKLSLSYNPDDKQLWYFRYANGFRIPQASRLYMTTTDTANFSLDPEVSDTFEIGYKLNEKDWSIEAAIYSMIIDDTIVRRTNDDGDRYYVNGDETEHQGIELTLTNHWSKQFSTRLAASHAKHSYKDDTVYGDNDQANAPETLANARLYYRPTDKITTMLEWEYTSEYWMDDNNTTEYDGHDILNLKVTANPTKQLRVFAKLNNVTDETYAENASLSFGKEKYTPGTPRQFFAGLEYQW